MAILATSVELRFFNRTTFHVGPIIS